MSRNKNIFAYTAVLVGCVILFLAGSSIQGTEKKYEVEVRPEITLPQYRTDTVRAIDAYESVMHRLLDENERNSRDVRIQLRSILEKLNSIDAKLNFLSSRVAKIERAVLPGNPKPLIGKKPRPEPAQNKTAEKPQQLKEN